MSASITIAGRTIGPGSPCFLIAEAGVNHNGDLRLALRLVDVAAEAGADAVKFQTFAADRLATMDAPKAEYQKTGTPSGETQYEMLMRLELTPAAHRKIVDRCREKGILFLSTPFDEGSADLLQQLDVPAFKLPSGELTNLPFLAHVAAKKRPLILSTGMASLDEVSAALETVRRAGAKEIALLHCVSHYPAEPREANLRAMETMACAFNVPVGFSDHTPGIEVSLAAVALGASVIEKHVTTGRGLPGPDHKASLEPSELSALVRGVRNVEAAMGDGRKRPAASEAAIAAVARKSLVAAADLPADTRLAIEHIEIRRPGTGLPPAMREQLVGRTLRVAVKKGTLLSMEMLS
jgi:N,N'-diacetyllegionaminate synthase